MDSINKNDLDPQETQEWVEAMEAVIERDGHERAQYIMLQLAEQSVLSGAGSPYSATVSYTHLTLPTICSV